VTYTIAFNFVVVVLNSYLRIIEADILILNDKRDITDVYMNYGKNNIQVDDIRVAHHMIQIFKGKIICLSFSFLNSLGKIK
jgi:hypothetical protein